MNELVPAMAILRREFLSKLRQRAVFRNLMFLLLPLMVLLTFFMYIGNDDPTVTSGAIIARIFFPTYVYFLYGACLLTGLSLGALGICSERETDTHDLLRMTCISPHALILAKLTSAVGICILTVISALPLLGLQFFFTGVDGRQFGIAIFVIFSTTLSGAMASLMCSARSRRSFSALGTALGAVLLLNGLLYPVFMLFTEFVLIPVGVPMDGLDTLRIAGNLLCPPIALGAVVNGLGSIETLFSTLLFQGLGFLIAWKICVRHLNRPDSTATPTPRREAVTNGIARRKSRIFPWGSGYPYPLPDGRNPMYFKELRESALALRRNMLRLFLAILVICLTCSLAVLFSKHASLRNGERTVVFLLTGLFLSAVPAFVAPSVAREYSYGNMDALRMTLLRPADVLLGKLCAAMRNLAIVFTAVVLGGIPLFLSQFHKEGIFAFGLTTAGSVLVSGLYALSTGLWASCTARQPLTGLVRAYLAGALTLFIVPYTLAGSFAILPIPGGTRWTEFLLRTSPYFAQLLNLENNRDAWINLPWLLNILIFAVASTAIIALAILRFGKHYAPAPGREYPLR